MMIICCTCKLEKDDSEFAFKSIKEQKYNEQCFECKRLYNKKHYELNKQIYINRNNNRRKEIKIKIFKYAQNAGCKDCGENDPAVLDFDHIENKDFDISRAAREGYAWERIEKEIKKCIVRCANCHRRKTAKEQGWYKGFGQFV